jgi:hypothetical protein
MRVMSHTPTQNYLSEHLALSPITLVGTNGITLAWPYGPQLTEQAPGLPYLMRGRRKSEKHDAKNTAAKWAAYHRSPPSCIGAGTIFYLANEAKPGWRTDSPKDIPERYAPSISPDQDQRNTYESPGDVDAQPVDLWAELAMPSLPEGALPERIEKLARHQSQLMGVDPGGIAAAALTVCAAAIPDRIQVRVKA